MYESHSVVSNSLQSHGLHSPWKSPGQNTGVGSIFLFQQKCIQCTFVSKKNEEKYIWCLEQLWKVHKRFCLLFRRKMEELRFRKAGSLTLYLTTFNMLLSPFLPSSVQYNQTATSHSQLMSTESVASPRWNML